MLIQVLPALADHLVWWANALRVARKAEAPTDPHGRRRARLVRVFAIA